MTYDWQEIEGFELEFSSVLSFPNCKTIDLLYHFPKLNARTEIIIFFKTTENMGVDLYILDRNIATGRTLKSELLAYNGPSLSNPNLMQIVKKERIP